MSAHGGGGDDGGGERWLVSYADFITLLMVLFVVLYSMGQTDVKKYKQLADSMKVAFSVGGSSKLVDPKINSASGSMEDGESKPIVIPGIPEDPPQTEEVAGQLTQMLSDNGIGNEVSVQTNIEGVMISLSEKLVFSPGSDQLAPEVYPLLDTIANMVIPIDNNVRLVGHTDDTPPLDSKYKNSFELSMARAMLVAEYLMSKGVAPERLLISGKGQYDPIFPNDTDQHRSLNGRVDIVVIYRVDNMVIGSDVIRMDPDTQYGLDTSAIPEEEPTEEPVKTEGGGH
ncbi:MAG: hypothetical protein CL609_11505 [Anaerolineaceae bacterium]|nr:hypothetical protein [Anaerolineaceae bacterium]